MLKIYKFFATFLDKKRRERYRARIERIRREQGLQEPNQTVTRVEKDLTVKAMGLTQLQGHWFKCPNGECELRSLSKFSLKLMLLMQILFGKIWIATFLNDAFVFDVLFMQEYQFAELVTQTDI